MVSSVNSATAKAGDSFTFRTLRDARDGAIEVPAGSTGRGIVAAVSAAAGTHRGTITLRPEYIDLGDGRRIAVRSAATGGAAFAARRHVFGLPLPGIVIGVVNPGGNVTIGPGTDFNVVPIESNADQLNRRLKER